MSAPLQILLVEDSACDALIAQRALEVAFACSITCVSSGAEGLRELKSHQYDFAILNQFLPDMEGVEITRRARQAEITTPIIISGTGYASLVVGARRSGADDHILKGPDFSLVLPEIVEQVRARRALQKSNEELKTALIEASRLASIGEVTAGIAHEIRNPMTVLLGMVQHLSESADTVTPDEIRFCADAILRNGRQMVRTLEDVLSGVSQSEYEPLDLCVFIEATLSFMHFDPAFRHRIQTSLEAEATPICVSGDCHTLRQVLINLLRNAAQSIAATGRTQGEVRVVAQICEGRARVSVIDDGVGIAPDAIPRLFQSGFSTKKNGERAEARGAGLGLSICRRIIEEHGGSISGANREDAAGAIFSIELPLQSS